MKKEDKVPTIKQCKRLVELGVVLETEKFWTKKSGAWGLSEWNNYMHFLPKDRVNAPDVAELGELLGLNTGFYMLRLGSRKASPDFKRKWCDYDVCEAEINRETEAQARCAALIWLIENDYLKAEEVK